MPMLTVRLSVEDMVRLREVAGKRGMTVSALIRGWIDEGRAKAVSQRPSTAASGGHTHFYPWSQVRAHRQGGPKPRCRSCGEEASS